MADRVKNGMNTYWNFDENSSKLNVRLENFTPAAIRISLGINNS